MRRRRSIFLVGGGASDVSDQRQSAPLSAGDVGGCQCAWSIFMPQVYWFRRALSKRAGDLLTADEETLAADSTTPTDKPRGNSLQLSTFSRHRGAVCNWQLAISEANEIRVALDSTANLVG